MSEFSESYHLRASRADDAVDLLRRAGLKGFVFPSANGWTTFVAEEGRFTPDPRLVAVNERKLVHYVSAEDHGWSFALFVGSEPLCAYGCSWEELVQVDDSQFNEDALRGFFGPDPADLLGRLRTVLHPATLNEVFENNPSHTFAETLGLTNFAWIAYDYLARDVAEGRHEYPGLIEVR